MKYILLLIAGALFANFVPHFVHGISGKPFFLLTDFIAFDDVSDLNHIFYCHLVNVPSLLALLMPLMYINHPSGRNTADMSSSTRMSSMIGLVPGKAS